MKMKWVLILNQIFGYIIPGKSLIKEITMAKSQERKKEEKKKPAKSLKEKRAAKKEKKGKK